MYIGITRKKPEDRFLNGQGYFDNKKFYKDIKKANVELTENQLMAILMYSQGGVKSLENFRNQQTNN